MCEAEPTSLPNPLGLRLVDGSLAPVPALIVSDVRLPEFGGLELLERRLCAMDDVRSP